MESTAWRVVKASHQGKKNQTLRRPCQDRATYALMPNLHDHDHNTLVAAVADGMGSAERGGQGAKIATQHAVRQMVDILWHTSRTEPHHLETTLNAAALRARIEIENLAHQQRQPLDAYATTLLLFIHANNMVATLQVGDGAAVIGTTAGLTTLAKPQRGEYANETNSLTSRRALQKAAIEIIRPPTKVDRIAMMTDGIMELSLDHKNRQPHAPFYEPLFAWLDQSADHPHPSAELHETLASRTIQAKTDDDTTLLLATRSRR